MGAKKHFAAAAMITLGFVGAAATITPSLAQPRLPAATTARDAPSDLSSQARQRAPTRLRIYRVPRALPPHAVRQCQAWYVQEWRPSGTVIVPRMQCWWEHG